MSTSSEITSFQKRCHQYFTCFTFATMGLQGIAEKLAPQIEPDKNPSLFIGAGHPDECKALSEVNMKEAISSSLKDGTYSDTLAKAIIVAIYSEWDEVYRHRIAKEVGVRTEKVKADLMGDIRRVRHCIIHNKSIVDNKCVVFKVLSWHLVENQNLRVTSEMFSSLINSINVMTATVNAAQPAHPHELTR